MNLVPLHGIQALSNELKVSSIALNDKYPNPPTLFKTSPGNFRINTVVHEYLYLIDFSKAVLFKHIEAWSFMHEWKFGVFVISSLFYFQLKILGHLDVISLLKMSQVCKEFQGLSADRFLWRRLFLSYFGSKCSLHALTFSCHFHEQSMGKKRQK